MPLHSHNTPQYLTKLLPKPARRRAKHTSYSETLSVVHCSFVNIRTLSTSDKNEDMITSVLISLVAAWLAVASLSSSEAFEGGSQQLLPASISTHRKGILEATENVFLERWMRKISELNPAVPHGNLLIFPSIHLYLHFTCCLGVLEPIPAVSG